MGDCFCSECCAEEHDGEPTERELAMLKELAELRRLRDRPLTMFGVWAHGGDDPMPSRVCLTDDGDGVDHHIDVFPLLSEVLRRQTKRWCRSVPDGEGPALEQLLALVPRQHTLEVHGVSCRGLNWAAWSDDDTCLAGADEASYSAAIRAATHKLLGLNVPPGDRQLSGSPARVIRAAMALAKEIAARGDGTAAEAEICAAIDELRGATAAEPQQTCGGCEHWQRDDEPATEGGARPCGLDEDPVPAPRHPASLCARPGRYKAHPCASCDEIGDCDYPWNLYRCDTCEQQRPWCQRAADAYPETCDDCVAALPLPEAKTDPAPDSDEQLPGVTQPAANVIRSRGDES